MKLLLAMTLPVLALHTIPPALTALMLVLDPDEWLGLALAAAILALGLWLLLRGRRASRWDFPAQDRKARQAALAAQQKAHEADSRRY